MAQQSVGISWRTDVDRAFQEAQQQQRNLLVDFSAAPM